MLNKYLVFAGLTYYPKGGWDDFVESYSTLEEIQQHFIYDGEFENTVNSFCYDWLEIVDTTDLSKIENTKELLKYENKNTY
jgi:hypothetical protein